MLNLAGNAAGYVELRFNHNARDADIRLFRHPLLFLCHWTATPNLAANGCGQLLRQRQVFYGTKASPNAYYSLCSAKVNRFPLFSLPLEQTYR